MLHNRVYKTILLIFENIFINICRDCLNIDCIQAQDIDMLEKEKKKNQIKRLP